MKRRDYRSPEAAEYRILYKSKEWALLRTHQLAKQPFCQHCLSRGIVKAATVVNHIKCHKGDMALFSSPANLASVCKPCHDGPIQSYERTGVMPGITLSGRPIDASHPWNAPQAITKTHN
jgi:5-methylcytosine-specific restriction endonuclease McrA